MAVIQSLLRLFTLRRTSAQDFPGGPGPLALLWLGGALVLAVVDLLSPYPALDWPGMFASLGAMMLAGLCAAWLLEHRSAGLRYGFVFMAIGLAALLLHAIVALLAARWPWLGAWSEIAVLAWALAAACRFIFASAASARPHDRIAAQLVAVIAFFTVMQGGAYYDRLLEAHYTRYAADDYRPIDQEALWTAQPALVAEALSKLPSPQAGAGRNFVLTIAAGGRQDIFGREAKAVGTALSGNLGGASAVTRLSNAAADLQVTPLASRTNLAAVMVGIGEGFDSQRDLAIIYLTAHGSQRARVTTDLPDYSELRPISARFLAESLDKAGITRRVVIISACFAGTWVEPLKSPDTIVLAAARADRTSFGCDDTREYTFFGKALLESGLGQGVSLNTAFEALKSAISHEESALELEPSLPQAFVGENMQDVWLAPLSQPR